MRPRRMRTADKVLIAAISAILAYWIAETVLLAMGGTGYPDTFTLSWFTFWSVELYAMAGIRREEIKVSPYTGTNTTREAEVG